MKFKVTKQSSFMIQYFYGVGWKVYSENDYVSRSVRRHIKRIQRYGMMGIVPNHRYSVRVTTYFGIFHSYNLV